MNKGTQLSLASLDKHKQKNMDLYDTAFNEALERAAVVAEQRCSLMSVSTYAIPLLEVARDIRKLKR